MTTWLNRRRISANPWPSRMRQTSRPERTRSLPMRDVEPGDEDLAPQALLDLGGVRAFEEKLHRFPEVGRGARRRRLHGPLSRAGRGESGLHRGRGAATAAEPRP